MIVVALKKKKRVLNERKQGKNSIQWKSLSVTTSHFSSVVQLCLTLCNPWTATCEASLSITNSWSLLKLMSIKSVMPSNHLILCHLLLLLPSIFPAFWSFLMSQFFSSGGQSSGASASVLVLPTNIQD